MNLSAILIGFFSAAICLCVLISLSQPVEVAKTQSQIMMRGYAI